MTNTIKKRHPKFRGNSGDLNHFLQLAASPIRSSARAEALKAWETYKITRHEAVRRKRYGKKIVKETWSLSARVLDLRGANLDGVTVGYADLRGVQFDGASLRGAWLKGVNLENASLRNTDLRPLKGNEGRESRLLMANLRRADFQKANLSGADLSDTDLYMTNFDKANLTAASLDHAKLVETQLRGTQLGGCRVYGISAWDLQLCKDHSKRQGLVVTPRNEPELTVDNIEVAQFIYLLLNNANIRQVIDTITSKVVLILGRFTTERKDILDAIREELRQRNYSPVLFDFDKPASKDLTGAVETLARMARFIIADLTDPSSIPHELATVVPFLRTTPVQPLRLAGTSGYSMFDDLKRYPWVLDTYQYDTPKKLIAALNKKVIRPAEAKVKELTKS